MTGGKIATFLSVKSAKTATIGYDLYWSLEADENGNCSISTPAASMNKNAEKTPAQIR